jgi:DNA-3-methyladenine glycosylase
VNTHVHANTPLAARALPRSFYERPTEQVARELIGMTLEHRVDGSTLRGRITETEAYLGEHDPACHAAVGRTPRTEPLYGRPGTAYVYFVYGMHWCVNAVTRREGLPSAVLIRAVEPIDGIEAMRARRVRARTDATLCDGPAKVCQAFGIDRAQNGTDLVRGALRITEGQPIDDTRIRCTPRIGISRAQDWPLRWIAT